MLYNSALKNGTYQLTNVSPTQRFEHLGCKGFQNNLLVSPYVSDFDECDVFYCEPPFPAGIKVFDERAGQSTPSYKDFTSAFSQFMSHIKKPLYAITNKRLLKGLVQPDASIRVKLNSNWETLSVWGGEVPPDGISNLQVCSWLGKRYRCAGDVTCGYGIPMMMFRKSRDGNVFVASDYDARCITVMRGLFE